MKIHKYFTWGITLIILMSLTFTSCITWNLEDLPAFEDANITDVKFEYRYQDTGDSWIDDEPVVKYVSLIVQDKQINEQAGTVTCSLQVPGANDSFTESIRNQVALSQIVGKFNLSTAATIKPLDGAPVLGVPGDFSSSRKYLVTAADGKTEKTWTIQVTGLSK